MLSGSGMPPALLVKYSKATATASTISAASVDAGLSASQGVNARPVSVLCL
jgi:hypothetical protein